MPSPGFDPTIILQNLFDSEIVLLKRTEVVIDSNFGTTGVTYTSYVAMARVVPITDWDLLYDKSGIIHMGQARGFFMPSYSFQGDYVRVMVGDRVFMQSTNWDVLKVAPFFDGNREIYLEALLDRIETDVPV